MAVKTVLRLGDPRLRQESAPVTDFGSDDLHQLVADMRDTMAAYDGAGLAAPQIGVMKRIAIFGVDQNPRYPDAETVPETVLCNPVIEPVSDQKIEGWEGCLSVPGLRGLVPRYAEIRYRGMDQEGRPIDRMAEGFHAIVVQHECDHLDGILYPDRIEDPTSFGFVEELADAGVIAAVAG